jgi:hypothetical protein
MQSRPQSLFREISLDAVYTYLKIELWYNSTYKTLKCETWYIIDSSAPTKEDQKGKVSLSLCLMKHHSMNVYGGMEVLHHTFPSSTLYVGE